MTTSVRLAFIAVTLQGLDQARRVRQQLQTGTLYRPVHYGRSDHVWEQPDETALAAQMITLWALHSIIQQHHLTRTTLILVGEALGSRQHRSRLSHTTHAHLFRRRSP
jgi:precorrin-4 methylase